MLLLVTSTLQDYSELIAVSLGINLAYIALSQYVKKGDNSQTPFFEILSRYATNTINRIKKKQTKGLDSLENNQIELEYFISSQKLSSNSTAIVNNIIDQYKEIRKDVDDLSFVETNRIQKYIEFKYYAHISLLLATYGLLLLFIAPLEIRLHFDLRCILFFANILITFGLIHAIIWELPRPIITDSKNIRLNKVISTINHTFDNIGKFLAPKFFFIIIFFSLFVIFFFYAIFNREIFIDPFQVKYPFLYRNAIVISLVLCFSNFIFYFIQTSIRHEISLTRFKKSLKKQKLEDKVNSYKKLEKTANEEMEANPLIKVSEISITEKKIDNNTTKDNVE